MNCLVIYAKYPQKGKVKTRLAKNIGDECALVLYKQMLTNIIATHTNQEYTLQIHYTPTDSPFQTLYPTITCSSQKGENLGERMGNTLKTTLTQYTKVVLIGSDNPSVDPPLIREAFKALNKNEIVIGPSFDGGYYLVGMSTYHEIFDNIEWGSENVLEQTKEKIKTTCAYLKKTHDVDTIADLTHYPALQRCIQKAKKA